MFICQPCRTCAQLAEPVLWQHSNALHLCAVTVTQTFTCLQMVSGNSEAQHLEAHAHHGAIMTQDCVSACLGRMWPMKWLLHHRLWHSRRLRCRSACTAMQQSCSKPAWSSWHGKQTWLNCTAPPGNLNNNDDNDYEYLWMAAATVDSIGQCDTSTL